MRRNIRIRLKRICLRIILTNRRLQLNNLRLRLSASFTLTLQLRVTRGSNRNHLPRQRIIQRRLSLRQNLLLTFQTLQRA